MTGSDESLIAVAISRIDDLRDDIKDIRADIARYRTESVSRGEWLQRNQLVDARLNSQQAELEATKRDNDKKHAPWWAVGSLVVAVVAALGALLPYLAHGV